MSLHNEIMNLPLAGRREIITLSGSGELAYKYGHRDARHAAAELAIAYERRIEELEFALSEATAGAAMWRKLVADTDKQPCEYPCLRDDLTDWIHDLDAEF